MNVTREQLADLRVGDVVELTFPSGSVIRGPLTSGEHYGPGLGIADVGWSIRHRDGERGWSSKEGATLTVISRAPRPLYVNHDRTEPVPGDVVRFVSDDHPDDSYTNAFLPRTEQDGLPWVSLTHDPGERYSDENADCRHLSGWRMVLLVNGETGQAVR